MSSGQSIQSGSPAGLLQAIADLGLGDLEGVFAYQDGQDLVKQGLGHRRRTRLSVSDAQGKPHVLYLKRYEPEPMRWRLRRWWTYGLSASPASIEAANVQTARQAGVPTMQVVAHGPPDRWAGDGRSYIIVTAVPGEALSRCASDFLARAGEQAQSQLTDKLATLVGRLHKAGLVHRDFYAAHVFLDQTNGRMDLYLIDLARCFRPSSIRRFRWRVKDLAQLKYSLPEGFVQRHWLSLIRQYMQLVGYDEAMLAGMESAIDAKVASMKRREARWQGRKR